MRVLVVVVWAVLCGALVRPAAAAINPASWGELGSYVPTTVQLDVVPPTSMPTYADELGYAVDVSRDGTVYAVGAPGGEDVNGNATGVVRVLERQADDSLVVVKVLYAPLDLSNDPLALWIGFGVSVALSAAGNTLVVGTTSLPGRTPAVNERVFLFERDEGGPGNWGLVSEIVLVESGTAGRTLYAMNVAVSDDGSVVVARIDDSSVTFPHFVGSVLSLARDEGGPGNWGQVGVVASGGNSARFCEVMAMSGPYLACSTLKGSQSTGTAMVNVYKDSAGDGNFVSVATLAEACDAVTGSFEAAMSLAFVGDGGAYLVVGDGWAHPTTANGGCVTVFGRDSGGPDAWNVYGTIPNPRPGTSVDGTFASSVAAINDTAGALSVAARFVFDGTPDVEQVIFFHDGGSGVFSEINTVDLPVAGGVTASMAAADEVVVVGMPTAGQGAISVFRSCNTSYAVYPSCVVPYCAPACVHGVCAAPQSCICDVGYRGVACDIYVAGPQIVGGAVVDPDQKDVVVSAGDSILVVFSEATDGGGVAMAPGVSPRAAVDALVAFDPLIAGGDGVYVASWTDATASVLNVTLLAVGTNDDVVSPLAADLTVRVASPSLRAANGSSFPADTGAVYSGFAGTWGTGLGVVAGEYPTPELLSLAPSVCPLVGCTLTLVGAHFEPGCNVSLGATAYSFRQLTYHNTTAVSIESPAYGAEGYRAVSISNLATAASTLERVMFFTDDCPTPGQFGRGLQCRPCPTGGVCPGGYRIWPQPGYWNPDESVGWVEKCGAPAEERCLGGQKSACGAAYGGSFCAECALGYYPANGECVSCGADPNGIFTALLLANVVFYGLFLVAALVVKDRALSTLSRVIITVQMIRGVAKLNVSRLSPELKAAYSYFALITMDAEFVRPGCVISSIFPILFWANAVLLIGTVMLAVVLIVAAAWLTGSHKFYRNRMVRTLVILLAMMYLSLSTYALRGGVCTRGADGKLRLLVEPSTVCYTGTHLPVAVVSYALLLFYVLGYPVVGFVGTLRNTSKLWVDPVFRSRFGFWYEQFKVGAYWFEFLQFGVYAVLAVCDSVFMYSEVPQFVMAMSALTLFLGSVAYWRPFESGWKNVMEAVFTTVSMSLVGLNYASGSLSESTNRVVSLVILFAFVIVFFVLLVIGIVYVWRGRSRSNASTGGFLSLVLSVVAQREEREAGHDLTRQPITTKVSASIRGLAVAMRDRLRDSGRPETAAIMPSVYLASGDAMFEPYHSSAVSSSDSASASGFGSDSPPSPNSALGGDTRLDTDSHMLVSVDQTGGRGGGSARKKVKARRRVGSGSGAADSSALDDSPELSASGDSLDVFDEPIDLPGLALDSSARHPRLDALSPKARRVTVDGGRSPKARRVTIDDGRSPSASRSPDRSRVRRPSPSAGMSSSDNASFAVTAASSGLVRASPVFGESPSGHLELGRGKSFREQSHSPEVDKRRRFSRSQTVGQIRTGSMGGSGRQSPRTPRGRRRVAPAESSSPERSPVPRHTRGSSGTMASSSPTIRTVSRAASSRQLTTRARQDSVRRDRGEARGGGTSSGGGGGGGGATSGGDGTSGDASRSPVRVRKRVKK